MIVNIHTVIVFGMAARIFGESHLTLPINVEIEDSFRFIPRQDPNVSSLKNLIDAKLDSFRNKRIKDSKFSSSVKSNSIYSNAMLAHMFSSNARMSSTLPKISQMYGFDDNHPRHVENVGERKRISKRQTCIYRSCCDCCRTQNVYRALDPVASSNLTQILSLGKCPDISRSSECRRCRCVEEKRTFWILREIPTQNQAQNQPSTSRLEFEPEEYTGRCVHGNSD